MAETNLIGETNDPNLAAVRGTHTTAGAPGVLGVSPANGVIGRSTGDGLGSSGVFGEAIDGPGVSGSSKGSVGVDARSENGPAALRAVHAGPGGPGVLGVSKANGVHGKSTGDGRGSAGVFGEAIDGPGVLGMSQGSVGVDARSENGPAALRAVHAGAGGPGVLGVSKSNGVHGKSTGDGRGSAGVFGEAIDGPGVSGMSQGSVGVDARTQSGPAALRAIHLGGGLAGDFGGDVHVTRNLIVDGDVQLTGADLAEQFGVVGALPAEPGTVVVLVGDDLVRVSDEAYDRRVAGIVSGAGRYRPGIVLHREPGADRCALALTGKVWCKVDADPAPVDVGDLLTTSKIPGHAMRASDSSRAFGAVVGKALGSLKAGRGLVPVLVALQ
jgi:hypothetical protein